MRDSPALEALNDRFGIPRLAAFETGAGGLPAIRVTARAADATVYLHGAHVTHYRPAGGQPVLFLSARSRFATGAAIRGGVPLVFPWFGARAGHPAAPDHGFARTCAWTVEAVERVGDGAAVTLGLEPSDATRALWPSAFRLTYRVLVDAALSLTLVVENRGAATFSFEAALHTYLAVGDVRRVSVSGLEGRPYIDKTDGFTRKVLPAGPLHPGGETDWVFPGAAGPCAVADPVLGRRLIVDKTDSATTVVWNPWSDKAARMADLGDDQWPGMLCVETANAMDDAVTLRPGERRAMGAVIRATPM